MAPREQAQGWGGLPREAAGRPPSAWEHLSPLGPPALQAAQGAVAPEQLCPGLRAEDGAAGPRPWVRPSGQRSQG